MPGRTPGAGRVALQPICGSLPLHEDVERGILSEDRLLEVLQGAARLDAELLDEHPPRLGVDLQRLGLTAAAVQRKHQLTARALTQRLAGDECLDFGDELDVAPSTRSASIRSSRAVEAELVEPRDLVTREGFEDEVGEGRPAPEA